MHRFPVSARSWAPGCTTAGVSYRYLKAPAHLGKELENLGTLQGQRKSRIGPVTPQSILHRGITEPLPRLCEATLTIRLHITNLSWIPYRYVSHRPGAWVVPGAGVPLLRFSGPSFLATRGSRLPCKDEESRSKEAGPPRRRFLRKPL